MIVRPLILPNVCIDPNRTDARSDRGKHVRADAIAYHPCGFQVDAQRGDNAADRGRQLFRDYLNDPTRLQFRVAFCQKSQPSASRMETRERLSGSGNERRGTPKYRSGGVANPVCNRAFGSTPLAATHLFVRQHTGGWKAFHAVTEDRNIRDVDAPFEFFPLRSI
jgi:hypothetical protein